MNNQCLFMNNRYLLMNNSLGKRDCNLPWWRWQMVPLHQDVIQQDQIAHQEKHRLQKQNRFLCESLRCQQFPAKKKTLVCRRSPLTVNREPQNKTFHLFFAGFTLYPARSSCGCFALHTLTGTCFCATTSCTKLVPFRHLVRIPDEVCWSDETGQIINIQSNLY